MRVQQDEEGVVGDGVALLVHFIQRLAAEAQADAAYPPRPPLLPGRLVAARAHPGEVADSRAVEAPAAEELLPPEDRVRLAQGDQPARAVEQRQLGLVQL